MIIITFITKQLAQDINSSVPKETIYTYGVARVYS